MSRTDGGVTDGDVESVFAYTSAERMTRSQRLKEAVDRKVLAPFRVLISDYRGILGLGIMLAYVLAGTVGVLVLPEPQQGGPSLLAPFQNLRYPLGTDPTGQGLFRQVVHATPSMLQMMFAGGAFASGVAVVVGLTAGYKRGIVDRVLMTVTDTAINLPGLPLIIVLSAIITPKNPFMVGLILSITGWAGGARSLRSQVLTLRNANYVESSRAMGLSTPRIIRKDVLPNLMPLVLVNFVNTARAIVFGAVALYFIGILPFTSLNWGVIMQLAYSSGGALYTMETAHWLLVPMVTLTVLAVGLLLLAQAFDRVFNPRLRAKHAKTLDDEDGATTTHN